MWTRMNDIPEVLQEALEEPLRTRLQVWNKQVYSLEEYGTVRSGIEKDEKLNFISKFTTEMTWPGKKKVVYFTPLFYVPSIRDDKNVRLRDKHPGSATLLLRQDIRYI
jgi:hypothetical protein